jgi:D-alanyl-D-alanine carboxypeptidase
MRVSLFALILLVTPAFADPTWNDALSQVDKMVRQKVEAGGVPSYSIAIASRDHPTFFASAGYADMARKTPATRNTVFEIGSITKVFTGTMLMQMRDAGTASLDDPLTKHLPEFSMPSPFTGKTAPTLRQLASHTAGLPRMIPLNSLQEPSGASVPDMLKSLGDTAAVYPPLTHYKYSNLGVDLLGYALARTAHMPWTDYVDRKILAPLGMNQSSAVKSRLTKSQIAIGYVPSGANGAWQPGPPMTFTPLTEASGSIVSTAADMAKFVAWEMDDTDPRVLSALSRREMRTPLWMLDDWSAGVAVTWFLQRFEGETLVHHTGGTAGFTAVAAFAPKSGVGIVVLTNSTDDAHGFARDLLRPALLAARAEREVAEKAAAAVVLPPGADKLAGTYVHDHQMLPPMSVALDKGALVLDAPLFGHAQLIPTGDPNVFTATANEGLDGETVVFEHGRLVIGHGAMVFVRAN